MSLNADDFRADCSNCAGLCCVAFAFDASEDFAIDKPAGVPCPNLRTEYLCSIHDRLEAEGFAGCVRYDCLGAGQLVVRDMFGGRGWRDDPALFAPMMDAFRKAREAQSLRAMLVAAGRFPLSQVEERRRRELIAACQPPNGWSVAWLEALLSGPVPRRVHAYVTSLRHHVERR